MNDLSMRILLFILCFTDGILVQSKSHEISHSNSNEFLKSTPSFQTKYEEFSETTEAKRESCLDDYRQQKKSLSYRRHLLSPFCAQYCSETMDCQQNNEQSACIDPSWSSSRTIRYVRKFERICYIRITEVVRYEQAERLCHKYGLQLAIIDNIQLLERLKQLNMFNTTCKGQCPTARGYYIGLRRLFDGNNQSESKWIWSNNVTWTQNETNCDGDSQTLYTNASLLCYIGNDGQKKMTVWNKDEPNNHRSNIYSTGEQCVEIIASTNQESSFEQIGKLNDIPCTKPTLGVICQMEDTKPMNTTRLEYFATIIGFNKTEMIDNVLSADFGGRISDNLNTITAMAAALEHLLVLPSFTIEQATSVFNIVDRLVNVTGQVNAETDSLKSVTNKLLHFIDLFPVKIQTDNAFFEYENMNMSIVDLHLDEQNNEWFGIKGQDNPNVIIEINIRVLQKQFNESDDYRIIQTIFSNFNLFPQINTTYSGTPISFHIPNMIINKTNEDLLRFQIRISEPLRSLNISCVYWSFDENNGSWIADNSCRFVGYIDNYAQCYCNHLTHFALLMLFESEQALKSLSDIEESILTYVTYIGIGLSMCGLIMTIITYGLFGRLHRNHLHGSLIMLCLSILFVNCLYIPFSLIQTNFSDLIQIISCILLGFLFHYSLISSFMWMLIMAIVQYLHFVRIFNTHISHFFIKICIIGWIIPVIFPSLVVLLGRNGGYIGQTRCWINNQILLYFTFLVPIGMIIIFNLILFGFILKSIYHRDTIVLSSQRNHSKIQMGAALCCFISTGCTWLFGLIVLVKPNFLPQLIFCICNSFQGFFIFLFHVYLLKPKREFWRIFFIQHEFRKSSHTSSDLMTMSNSIIKHSMKS